MSKILEKLKKLASKLPEAEQDEFFEFVAALGENEPPQVQADEPPAQEPPAEEPPSAIPESQAPENGAETEQSTEPSTEEATPTAKEPLAEQKPENIIPTEEQSETQELPPNPDQDTPDEGEFFNGQFEDIQQMVKAETDESAIYDESADNVEMHGGDSDSGDGIAIQPSQEETAGNEQGDVIASLQAKITALEAENAQMKSKFGASFGYGNAPSMAKGRYQTRDDFIRSLPQVRKG